MDSFKAITIIHRLRILHRKTRNVNRNSRLNVALIAVLYANVTHCLCRSIAADVYTAETHSDPGQLPPELVLFKRFQESQVPVLEMGLWVYILGSASKSLVSAISIDQRKGVQ